jgi:hypothetical protein
MRLFIIGCGKSKIWDKNDDIGPQKAEDVYTSGFATLKREYAQSQSCDWMILSAKYGFIRPDFVIPGPYNVTFDDPSTHPIPVPELRQQVRDQQLDRYDEITIVAGRKYIDSAKEAFDGTTARIAAPFAGLPMGQQMHMMCQEMAERDPARRAGSSVVRRRSTVSDTRATGVRTTGVVNADVFRKALRALFDEAKGDFVDVTSGDLYRIVGGRTGRDYRMATCCGVMISLKRPGDTTLAQPPKGKGATLTIRYVLPR